MASLYSSAACLRVRRVPPTSTGFTLTVQACTHSPKHLLTSSTSARASLRASLGGEGWITVVRTPGYGEEGNADVFRVRIEDGEVVREVNLTKSEIWDSAPVWGSHQPVG